MSKVKSKDTNLEIFVRKKLFAAGFRYKLNYKIDGKPDIVFIRKKIAVFINGCFWHQHNCDKAKRPETNKDFWNKKLDRNIQRDKEVESMLMSKGWRILRVWECQVWQANFIEELIAKLRELYLTV